MKKIIILITFLALGCAKDGDSNNKVPDQPLKKKLESLVDDASAEERQLLDENLTAVKAYAAEFSETIDFAQVPILVTKQPGIIKTGNGLCLYDGHKGLKVYIKKDYFTADVFAKDTGFSSNIFNLLIHEIGHCYFLRKHEHVYLSKEGQKAQFKIETSAGTSTISYYSIPASMMTDDDSFKIPKKLEKYYIGEILGKFRATTLDELHEKYEFDIVPQ
ncbi:MAG: hypothetical protein ACXVCP_12995 [Bdellovibrio sp.]